MTAIWTESASGWNVLSPAGFPDERSLQELVATAPDMLPLSGSPRVVVLGREVRLGTGYVDVLAIEPGGRPVLIEVKLRNNSESRRAVVAQILAYAAALHGTSAERFERVVLAGRLDGSTLVDVVAEAAQVDLGGGDDFRHGLDTALRDGGFRLVLVLDQVPQELVRLVGYLETMTRGLVVDLVVVTSYDVDGRRVVVPQRVEPDAPVADEKGENAAAPTSKGEMVAGVEAFRDASGPVADVEALDRVVRWAVSLQQAGLAQVSTYIGDNGDVVLLPRLQPEGVGLVSAYRYANGRVAVQFWRSVFERRAPGEIAPVEAAASMTLGRGNKTSAIDDALLDRLTAAYRAALTPA